LAENYFNQAQETASPEKRLALLEKAIDQCPSFAGWYSAGRIHLELGQPEAAAAAFQEAHQLADSEKFEALSLGRLGEAYKAQGKAADGLATVDSALERLGEDTPPDWLTDLRRRLDVTLADEVLSARTIKDVLTVTRSFSVEPKVQLRVHFGFDSAELDDEGWRQVQELGQALTEFTDENHQVLIIGHTDQQGEEDYNQRLSEARANTVVAVLQQQFPELKGMLAAEGRGESALRYKGSDEQDHYLNRRVEVRLVR
jgi:outer membrane protein OmpA-like peptidoglycan-associated protein